MDLLLLILLGLAIIWRLITMSQELERVRAEIAENTAVTESVLVLVEDLAQKIRDNLEDTAALAAIADELDANSNKLAAAVAANSPADEEVVEEDLEPIQA